MSWRWTVLALLGCSRPAPIVADPVRASPSQVDAAPAAPTVTKDRYFMDTSDGDKDCYRDVWCRLQTPACPNANDGAKYDDKWTKKLRAEQAGEWCCYSRTICEFPAAH